MTSRSRSAAPARRKPAPERSAEIVAAAGAVALSDGLDKVTAKRVAAQLGVFPGLIAHYVRSADELVAIAFATAVTAERDEVYARAQDGASPTDQLRLLLDNYVDPARDAVALLWLDAWQASRRRPALHDEVARQMNHDLDQLSELIATGQQTGEFRTRDSRATAMRILALVDGLSVQAAIRDAFDYTDVQRMLWRSVEHELGLDEGTWPGP
ncbi:MAG TPA: TetR family transcriptional regulator C-terminal domain-containing protein [Streptosporangiaceae bacterium]|jgi:AcrR family transcriptional regulator